MLSRLSSYYAMLRRSVNAFIRTRSLREAINVQFSADDRVVLQLDKFDHIVMPDGNKFKMTRSLGLVAQAYEDYRLDDIRKTDIVVDIGASIGGFSIPAAQRASRVCSIEPMTPHILRSNIELNGISNITVHDIGLGDGGPAEVEWMGERKKIETRRLGQIIAMSGGCDFLKIDCEGLEWTISPEELSGIRRIEMEVHKVGYPITLMEGRLRAAGFAFETVIQADANIGLWLVHATRVRVP